LSHVASSKLRDNNPNITDLSDQNRPTKIAEKMSELYDNQWTDAFDALEKKNASDLEIITALLTSLMVNYKTIN
jgi:flagellin-specific chaperone FliS